MSAFVHICRACAVSFTMHGRAALVRYLVLTWACPWQARTAPWDGPQQQHHSHDRHSVHGAGTSSFACISMSHRGYSAGPRGGQQRDYHSTVLKPKGFGPLIASILPRAKVPQRLLRIPLLFVLNRTYACRRMSVRTPRGHVPSPRRYNSVASMPECMASCPA